MKKITIDGLVLLTSLSLVGCNNKEVTKINFENYYYQDTEDKTNIEEFIEVSMEANEISDYTIKQILETMGSKNIDTNIIVGNIQGVQVAKLKETNNKISIDIDKNYKTRKKNNISLTNSSKFRECSELQRDIVEGSTLEAINNLMEIFSTLSNTLGKKLNQSDLIAITEPFSKQTADGINLSQVVNKSKEIKDSEKLTKAIDLVTSANNAYIETINTAKTYQESKTQENLSKFKSAVLEFRRYVATYQVQVDSLDGEGMSLTEQLTN